MRILLRMRPGANVCECLQMSVSADSLANVRTFANVAGSANVRTFANVGGLANVGDSARARGFAGVRIYTRARVCGCPAPLGRSSAGIGGGAAPDAMRGDGWRCDRAGEAGARVAG